jgi:hypothetical protein
MEHGFYWAVRYYGYDMIMIIMEHVFFNWAALYHGYAIQYAIYTSFY